MYGVPLYTDPENLKVVPKEKWYAAPAKPPTGPTAGGKE